MTFASSWGKKEKKKLKKQVRPYLGGQRQKFLYFNASPSRGHGKESFGVS